MGAKIQAISYYLPEKVLTNHDLAERFTEWTPDEIEHQTGIVERHYSAEGEIASDCAVAAAEQAELALYSIGWVAHQYWGNRY